MFRYITIFLFSFFLVSCSGNYQDNQQRLDDVYGECDNPTKRIKLNDVQYKACKAKERAAGESLFNLEGDLNDLISGRRDNNIVYMNSVNPHLWRASLDLTSSYALKIADNQGGFIETDWITNSSNQNQRCLIKIKIVSSELISTGVSTKFICEKRDGDSWISDGKNYLSEEKQLTLKILKTASILADSEL
jgi:hypothetical protein